MRKEKLLKSAMRGLNNAYSPYSKYLVGTALVTKNNKIFFGCNIENNGIQAICAERVAFSKAISNGYNEFKEILIIGKQVGDKYLRETLSCGYCRQFMSEFCDDKFKIISYDEEKNKYKEYLLKDLLPNDFSLKR